MGLGMEMPVMMAEADERRPRPVAKMAWVRMLMVVVEKWCRLKKNVF
jgi:hypothetical protein